MQDVLKEQPGKPQTTLHIADGESVAGTLRQSTVPGEVQIFGDLMYEGPAPAGLSDAEWWDTRARFLSESFVLIPRRSPSRCNSLRGFAACHSQS